MLFATRCPVCGAIGAAPCSGCAARLLPAPLLTPPPGVDSCAAVFAYDGAGRILLSRLKYRNARASLGALASAMVELVDRATVDVVTWVPTTAARRRQRGFDQAELLARAMARRLRRPYRALLLRSPGPAQTGRGRAERHTGPRFAGRGPISTRVLLVDDVITTGATVSAAAAVLRAAGASEVHVVAAARTPCRQG